MTKKAQCNNCWLFDSTNGKEGFCKVSILHEGEKINIPVYGCDACFFEDKFVSKDGEEFKPEVEQIKMWVEDEKGNRIDGKGTVKIEFPDSLLNQTLGLGDQRS